jgi:hypothetical protein
MRKNINKSKNIFFLFRFFILFILITDLASNFELLMLRILQGQADGYKGAGVSHGVTFPSIVKCLAPKNEDIQR